MVFYSYFCLFYILCLRYVYLCSFMCGRFHKHHDCIRFHHVTVFLSWCLCDNVIYLTLCPPNSTHPWKVCELSKGAEDSGIGSDWVKTDKASLRHWDISGVHFFKPWYRSGFVRIKEICSFERGGTRRIIIWWTATIQSLNPTTTQSPCSIWWYCQ